MIDADDNCYILEVNTAPSQTSPYRQQCVAKALDYIAMTESKDIIPVVEQRGGYRKFIHAGVCGEAIIP